LSAQPTLDRLQRWMQAAVVHPGDIETALRSPSVRREIARADLDAVILPSATLDPAQRVGIYQNMYLLRMEEALATDYPGLKHFLGDDGFFSLVRDYVQVHPSRSFTLNHLGDRLPDFVAVAPDVRRRDFCHDLARLEQALSQVFDAPETKALAADVIDRVSPEAWEHARLTPIAAFRLLALRYPASAYLDTLKDEQHGHPPSRRRDTYVAVYRRDYSVYRHDLTRGAHDLLADLVAGQPLGRAVAAALKRGGRNRPRPDDLFRWFRQWVAGGIFAKVDLS
jgi:hypothetical protein